MKRMCSVDGVDAESLCCQIAKSLCCQCQCCQHTIVFFEVRTRHCDILFWNLQDMTMSIVFRVSGSKMNCSYVLQIGSSAFCETLAKDCKVCAEAHARVGVENVLHYDLCLSRQTCHRHEENLMNCLLISCTKWLHATDAILGLFWSCPILCTGAGYERCAKPHETIATSERITKNDQRLELCSCICFAP